MGILEVVGSLSLTQFWPQGDSDGDTAHVTIDRIQFRSNGKATDVHVFDNAHITGREGTKNVISDKNGVRSLLIRLQGIDAPELHFSANVKRDEQQAPNHFYRQHLGEASAKALHDELRKLFPNATTVPCRVTTQVEKPNDVFDVFGRLVGDIIVKKPDGKEMNINQWMTEHGWALPAFYVSMTPDEIEKLAKLGGEAQKTKRGVWKSFSKNIAFDPQLIHHRPTEAHPGTVDADDPGPVLFPKLFRRLVTEFVKTGDTTALHDFISAQHPPDEFIRGKEFLAAGDQGAKHNLSTVVSDAKADFEPADVVFTEATSTLFDQNGQKITEWG